MKYVQLKWTTFSQESSVSGKNSVKRLSLVREQV